MVNSYAFVDETFVTFDGANLMKFVSNGLALTETSEGLHFLSRMSSSFLRLAWCIIPYACII